MSFTVDKGQVLHEIRSFSHENLILAKGLLELLVLFDESLEEDCLTVFEQVQEGSERCDVSALSNLPEWALGHLWKLMALLVDVGDHIFANLDHEDTIVAFGSATSVSCSQVVPKLIAGQKALTSAPFSADRGNSF